jgi:hypothetical protein
VLVRLCVLKERKMKQEKKSKLRKLIGVIRGLFSSFRRTDQVGHRKPEQHKAYGAYFKKVEGSDLYTLFGDDRWSFAHGFPIERKRGKKLNEKLRKLDETEDFIPQMVVSRRKP